MFQRRLTVAGDKLIAKGATTGGALFKQSRKTVLFTNLALAQIAGVRDDLGVVALLEPRNHDRGVEAA